MDKNSIDCFDILYIKNLAPMKIALADSARFGELKMLGIFADTMKKKWKYMHECMKGVKRAVKYEYFNGK